MSNQPKWSIHIEDVHGTVVFVVMRGRSKEGCGSAGNIDAAMEMAKELYFDCRAFHKEPFSTNAPLPTAPTATEQKEAGE